MVPFVQECNAYQCNPSQCREALRQFYSALPHNVAEKLVFCDCDREDQECQQMKASLHSGSCASDRSQTPRTCLEALDSCSEDTLCRLALNIEGKALTKCFTAGNDYRSSFLSTSYKPGNFCWATFVPNWFGGENHTIPLRKCWSHFSFRPIFTIN